MKDEVVKLSSQLNNSKAKINEPLSHHTTLKIGGPADIYYEATSTEEFIDTIRKAKTLDVPVTVLGWGSNVLISDQGIRGLVIRNLSKNIKITEELDAVNERAEGVNKKYVAKRLDQPEAGKEKYIGKFDELDYDESDAKRVAVKFDAGVGLIEGINWTIANEITGLQWFARIPGNIGGIIYNNVHGGTHFISEYVHTVRILDEQMNIKELEHKDLKLDYDMSRFHQSHEIILDAIFHLYKGDAEKAKYVVGEWGRRKIVQPWNSPGCTFANLTEEQTEIAYNLMSNEDKEKHGKSTSIGWLVEHILGMSGYAEGDVMIHDKHHNFIVNNGKGNANDFLKIVKEITKRAKEKGLDLKSEIFFLGFTDKELEGVNHPHSV